MIRPGSDKNVKDKPSKIGCHGASRGLHKNREGGENILSGNPHWWLVDCPTQLICSWIFICCIPRQKNTARKSANWWPALLNKLFQRLYMYAMYIVQCNLVSQFLIKINLICALPIVCLLPNSWMCQVIFFPVLFLWCRTRRSAVNHFNLSAPTFCWKNFSM